MVIIHLSGGFGNQLFSFAFGYAMAKMREDMLVIDTAIQDAPWFFRNPDILNLDIQYDKRMSYKIGRTLPERALLNRLRFRNSIGWKTKIIRESDCSEKKTVSDLYEYSRRYQNIYLKGNWASIECFENVRQEIMNMYLFKTPLTQEAERVAEEIAQCSASVTVHCRRGDYVRLGACISADYFIAAMKYMCEQLENPVFYCFSEDQEWAKRQFAGLPYHIKYPEYQSEEKGVEDFRLLSTGRHQIIANSSYSWWAAYLNKNPNKIVVMPLVQFAERGFFVQDWIKLPYETE